MSRRPSGRRAPPAAETSPRSPMRTAIRLAVMTAVIIALASAAVWQRARLTPARASASARGAGRLPAPASELLRLIDAERERAGCAPLRPSGPLSASAAAHAADMAARGYASETGPDGTGPRERAAQAGYRGQVAEIIAAGIPAPGEVLAQWANHANPASAGIVAKMTDCRYASAGIGYDPARVLPTFLPGIWVVDLGNR
jgi:uncharacterized protein YkwD